ncbi:hypothetical protein PV433_33650 [Paenibacillus sp. GYB004]|uniref:hypothetical protein n=1 Tax=Paenibacillus sp. GYB004 TaxID=2994393 RepID=UPI002F961F28
MNEHERKEVILELGSAEAISDQERRTSELRQAIQNDSLYSHVPKEYDLLSPDIMSLDPAKLYSTKDVVEILSKYPYFYDAIKGESYINENRVRWWLNEKDEDNLIFYFNLDKPSRNWVWTVYSIVQAKIVAILRFVLNHQQKYIKSLATGLIMNAPKVSDENVIDLVANGSLSQVKDMETLKNIVFSAMLRMEKRYQSLDDNYRSLKDEHENMYGELEVANENHARLKEEFESLKNEHQALTGVVGSIEGSTKELFGEGGHLSRLEDRINDASSRGTDTFEKMERYRQLKLEAFKQWDSQTSVLKRMFGKSSDREEFIENYIYERLKAEDEEK